MTEEGQYAYQAMRIDKQAVERNEIIRIALYRFRSGK